MALEWAGWCERGCGRGRVCRVEAPFDRGSEEQGRDKADDRDPGDDEGVFGDRLPRFRCVPPPSHSRAKLPHSAEKKTLGARRSRAVRSIRRVPGRRAPRGGRRGARRAPCRRVVQRPDHHLALEDGERDVGLVCGYVVFEGLGGVGETAAAQKTASSRTSWLGTVRPASRNGQRSTKATITMSVNPAAAAQSLRRLGASEAASPAGLEDAHDVRGYPRAHPVKRSFRANFHGGKRRSSTEGLASPALDSKTHAWPTDHLPALEPR